MTLPRPTPPYPLPRLSLFDTDPAEYAVDAVVIGLHRRDDDPAADPIDLLVSGGGESIVAAFDGQLVTALRTLGATGKAGEVIKLATLGTITAPLVVAVGLGPEPAGALPPPEVLRRGVGAALRSVAGHRSVALAMPVSDDDTLPATVRTLAEGALLGGYRFDRYRTTPSRQRPVGSVAIHVPDARDRAVRAALKQTPVTAGAVVRARDWVNTAPNELRPPDFADQVAQAATEAGLTATVLDEKALRKGGYGGILAVGQGSQAPPRLVRLDYVPKGTPRAKVALVGKGITFDTGGVSIKPAQGMWEMKSDMAGAAAVAATMLAVAEHAPQLAVTGWLPLAENMPSGSAYRPGDVLTMYNSTKVEVLNTDAEGRLILADAIARACEEEPDYLLETSTLTGGQIISLGRRVAGVMGSTELCEQVRRAGEAVGEPAWPMPLPDDVRQGLESAVADISHVNTGLERVGTMLQGGIFLSEFVTDPVQWAHIDIAGPAYHAGEAYGYITTGGTGVPVRTLLHLLDELASGDQA
ncbi:leucyl aminopeptidase [Natronosporangium hydrolyticum]|uniref:leucyl aminopeptidase n=1 Tax=Natronosporangium hydrolyticum TaxID=2811111 RepID=UPI001EFA0F35|nr:leucyl aminopeptidase [Natronosporangium hydrolyticum]